jgi:hypothetical protein
MTRSRSDPPHGVRAGGWWPPANAADWAGLPVDSERGRGQRSWVTAGLVAGMRVIAYAAGVAVEA